MKQHRIFRVAAVALALALALSALPTAFAASSHVLKYEELEGYIKKGNYDYKLALNQLDNVYSSLDTIHDSITGMESQMKQTQWTIGTLQDVATIITRDGVVSDETVDRLKGMGVTVTTSTTPPEAVSAIQFRIGALNATLGSLSGGIIDLEATQSDINKSSDIRKSSKEQILAGYLLGARTSFYGLYSQMAARDMQKRNLAFLESQKPANEAKLRVGLLSDTQYSDFLKKIDDQKVAVENANHAIKKGEDSLKAMLGIPITDYVTLEAPHKGFDYTVIDSISYYSVEAEYLKNSPAVKSAKKSLDLAKDDYSSDRTTANEYAVDKAKLELEKAETDAKLALRSAVQALKDAYRDLKTEEQDLKKLRNDLQKMRRKLERGLVSRLQVQQMELQVELAEYNLEISRCALYHQVRCYEDALKGGSLPSAASQAQQK
ncbi:TolC family protein [Oscillospiraceae bacterium OttesenSCG-928-G22]|nr:TolC family protein [Oscillospiraceae bacterium OttesenSCG-928-G22]